MTLFNGIRRGHLIQLMSCMYLGFFLLCLLSPYQVDGRKIKEKDESTTSAAMGSWLKHYQCCHGFVVKSTTSAAMGSWLPSFGSSDDKDSEKGRSSDFNPQEGFNVLRTTVKLIEKEQLVLVEELTAALNLTDRPALLKYLVEELKDSHFVVETWRNDIYGFRTMKEDRELRMCLQKGRIADGTNHVLQ